MPHSHFKQPARARALAICFCALAALLTGTAAHARIHSRARPTISGTPASTDVAGDAYSFTPTASAPSGYTLKFSISGKPTWASFNTATGRLTGTPTTANVGSFADIAISVSDGVARASLAPFTIKVSAPTSTAPTNTPPTISGTAPTAATVGTLYNFTPKASDGDGDALSFSVQNLPAWAIFSIATGTISGTPVAANVGTDSNIVISVSDGYTSASLAPFSIEVSQPVTSGTATLTWTAPTTNTNGSALTDLAGYHIYYGTSPSALSSVVDIPNPGTTTYAISSLASGTWYFAVNAYTTSGTESALSNTGSKSIP
ncbi:MAG: putative Ig domain-containing protein [Steroidobacteraceae bacterium]